MKNLIFAVLLLSGLWLFPSGCGEVVDVDKLLQNTEIRNEIFTSIAGDQEMMRQFMDHVRSEQGSMSMMMNDLPGMMRNDPEMMHGMMQHMTNAHILPWGSFNQANLDLEWKFGPRPFQSKFTPALLRTESTGRQTGNLPIAIKTWSTSGTS